MPVFSSNLPGHTVVDRIAETAFIIRAKIARTECLQGMFHDKLLRTDGKTLLDVVVQFAYDHARGKWAVVAHRLPNIADVKNVARRDQRFQKQRTIIHAAVAIPRPAMLRDQIEFRCAIAPRVSHVVHPEQTYDLEWDAAHGFQCAKRHRAGKETSATARVLQHTFHLQNNNLARNRIFVAGSGADTAELSQSAAQLVQFQLRGFIGIEKLIYGSEQVALPIPQ